MVLHADVAILKGYKRVDRSTLQANVKFPNGFFQVKFFGESYVILDPQHLKEFFDASESDLSFRKPIVDFLQLHHTFQESIAVNGYHVIKVKTELSGRRLSSLIPDILDELEAAMNDEIVLDDGTIFL